MDSIVVHHLVVSKDGLIEKIAREEAMFFLFATQRTRG